MRILIVCGESYEEWDPTSLEKGIGGSETAVIHMARELSDIGHHVTVYNRSKGGIFDGVSYIPLSEELPAETDVVICWRTPDHIMKVKEHVKYKQSYLWLHDMVPQREVLPYIHFYDKIFALSMYHRATYYDINDDKFFITRNGIDLPKLYSKAMRNPYRIAYFSSYDRGLRFILENWTRLKLSFPKLELVFGYGWESLEKQNEGEPAQLKIFKEYMENLFDQEGVTHLGRVSQAEVYGHLQESQLWAYPCIWPETSCIVAMQAQAMGTVPVVIPNAALQETVLDGYRTEHTPTNMGRMDQIIEDEWVEQLVKALQEPEKVAEISTKLKRLSILRFTWSRLAMEWDDLFSGVPLGR